VRRLGVGHCDVWGVSRIFEETEDGDECAVARGVEADQSEAGVISGGVRCWSTTQGDSGGKAEH
jgi:hypothetical protein